MSRLPTRPPGYAWLLLSILLLSACWPFTVGPPPTPSTPPSAAPSAIPTSLPAAQPSLTPTALLPTATPLPPTPPPIGHVLLISVDGLRPEAIAQAETPHMDRLWQDGAYSWRAQTILPSSTLPSHAAMLTGLPPEVTGVVYNTWSPGEPYITFTTALGLAHEAGLSTAAFFGKGKLESLFPPGSRGHLVVTYGDVHIAEQAAAYIAEQRPALVFVHLPEVDGAGHTYGWMSQEQLQAVEEADTAVGLLLAALEEAGIAQSTAVLLTADHGGHGFGHGSDLAEDTTIPWILYGPGIAAGEELQGEIYTYDTAATVAELLGLPIPADWWGRPITAALTSPSLALLAVHSSGITDPIPLRALHLRSAFTPQTAGFP